MYFPALELSLAVATNIETNTQEQPKEVLCFAYNDIAVIVLQQNITYHAHSVRVATTVVVVIVLL